MEIADRADNKEQCMGKIYESLDTSLIEWIARQHLFFTATAPRDGGSVNCSPKGSETLRVLDPRTVAYLDLTGSGVETIAHLRDNGRIVLMFCAFDGPPKIVRLHGQGTVLPVGHPRYDALLPHFLPLDALTMAAARSVILVAVHRIADSCGYGVPLMDYGGARPQQGAWTENRLRTHGPTAIQQYQAEKNLSSIDGLPGLDASLHPLRAACEPSVP